MVDMTYRRTGYMTLPLPVIGNLYAPTNLTASKWEQPEYGKTATDGRMILAPTMKQRGTPAIYWAVLWNRCLAYIDDHSHYDTNPQYTTQEPNESSHSGKRLRWGGRDAFRVIGNPTSTSSWVSGIYIDEDLDLQNSPYTDMAVQGSPGFAMEGLYSAGLATGANPVDESVTMFFPGRWTHNEMSFPADMTDPNLSKRYSLFARMRINGAGNTQLGTETQISNFNYAPSITLTWNAGMNNGQACELVTNEPSGAVLGDWKFLAYDPTRESTGGVNEADTFQNPPMGTGSESDIPRGGYYYKDTLRPFLGILDTGNNGFKGWDLSGSTDNTYTFQPEYWTSASHIRWDNSTYTTNATLTIYDRTGMQDPKLEIPRPISEDMKGEIFFSPYVNEMSWFQDSDQAYRCGSQMVFSDVKGNASTYNLAIALANSNYSADDVPVYIRWYNSTGVQKTYSWTSTGASGDVLTITQNYGSCLLIKAPFEWEKSIGTTSVAEGNVTGGSLVWFAYFTE